jgi:hypothetical protein
VCTNRTYVACLAETDLDRAPVEEHHVGFAGGAERERLPSDRPLAEELVAAGRAQRLGQLLAARVEDLRERHGREVGRRGHPTGLYAEPRRSMLVCIYANPTFVTRWLE